MSLCTLSNRLCIIYYLFTNSIYYLLLLPILVVRVRVRGVCKYKGERYYPTYRQMVVYVLVLGTCRWIDIHFIFYLVLDMIVIHLTDVCGV
jgi:hypothetical protein